MGELVKKNIKNFNGLPFKMKIPTIRKDANNIWVQSALNFNEFEMSGIKLLQVLIKKGSKKCKTGDINEFIKPKIDGVPVSVCLERDVQFPLIDSMVTFKFSSEKFFYYVEYKILNNSACCLESSRIEKMDLEELKQYNSDKKTVKKTVLDRNNIEDVLDFYKKKVYREMCFIRDEGGKSYQVTNGTLLSSAPGRYLYSFELNTQCT